MNIAERLALFSMLDYVAVGLLAVLWLGSTHLIEHSPKVRPSTSSLMAQYRREWMVQFVHRDPRIFDSQIIAQLRQGTAFFASGSMIAIGGALALLGNAERLRGVAEELTQTDAPLIVWEIKLFLMVLFAANAFLKFVWSHRLFGYCSVLMAAVPNDPGDPVALPRATKAGEINIIAARAYNRGLRSVYFGIASVAWLAGAPALILAGLFTAGVILRREFASQSREVLLAMTDSTKT
ncbi:DUF599 domain-containing protein [Tropicibacter oceani]|uniref:DUF599 domain-containing protein n=1 Tax=Tropicibacter oceani TaxID=3058420 RepID=A0ABY8QIG2_9RHOB|nr:DUF599 domain-containing protein [Tropicibacter oceani]WGW04424.1 DUF599 domain-containing protein [Tropicibacter oceani]